MPSINPTKKSYSIKSKEPKLIKQDKINLIEKYVSQKMSAVDGGHDMGHIYRVLKNAKLIQKQEGGKHFVVEAGAILHDVLDEKFFDLETSETELKDFLIGISINDNEIEDIISLIKSVSFGNEFDGKNNELSDEAKIVCDADKLDAMGAIGIARTFHYGGYKNRKIYDAEIPPIKYSSKEEYHNSTAPTINHFYEKLLLLKDKMHTQTGIELASRRHDFMLQYLVHFFEECQELPFDLNI